MKISIKHEDEMRFVAVTGQHHVTIDLPVPHGGTNQGMSPPQLFVASLGACVGVYIVDYCENEGINYKNLSIDLDWVLELTPKRIKRVNITVDLPMQSLSDMNRKQLMEVASKCLVHNTLEQGPEIIMTIPVSECPVIN